MICLQCTAYIYLLTTASIDNKKKHSQTYPNDRVNFFVPTALSLQWQQEFKHSKILET